MSTLDLYNVQKAGFWNKLLAKERTQSFKAIYAIKTIRQDTCDENSPVDLQGALLPGRHLPRAPICPSEANKPEYLRRSPIVRKEPLIPEVTKERYSELKANFRPNTAPVGRTSGTASPTKYGIDPRFSSQVGYQLFGFSDIQKTFPVREGVAERACEYNGSNGEYQDMLAVHQRKQFRPSQIYSRPTTASQDVGWNAFDQEFYLNRVKNKALLHPRMSSHITKFAAALKLMDAK